MINLQCLGDLGREEGNAELPIAQNLLLRLAFQHGQILLGSIRASLVVQAAFHEDGAFTLHTDGRSLLRFLQLHVGFGLWAEADVGCHDTTGAGQGQVGGRFQISLVTDHGAFVPHVHVAQQQQSRLFMRAYGNHLMHIQHGGLPTSV